MLENTLMLFDDYIPPSIDQILTSDERMGSK